jgi:hypothetical protein
MLRRPVPGRSRSATAVRQRTPGKGVTSEALGMLTRYLFETRNIKRIRLCIDHR